MAIATPAPAEPFCWKNEIKYVLNNLQKELSYYTKQLLFYRNNKDGEYYEMVQMIEMIINSYRMGLVDFLQDFESCDYRGSSEDIANEIVNSHQQVTPHYIGFGL